MYNPNEDPGWDGNAPTAASPVVVPSVKQPTWKAAQAPAAAPTIKAAHRYREGGAPPSSKAAPVKSPEEVEKELRAQKSRELSEVHPVVPYSMYRAPSSKREPIEQLAIILGTGGLCGCARQAVRVLTHPPLPYW